MSFFKGVTVCSTILASLEEVGLEGMLATLVVLLCCPHPKGGTTLLDGTVVQGWHKSLHLTEDADKVCQVISYYQLDRIGLITGQPIKATHERYWVLEMSGKSLASRCFEEAGSSRSKLFVSIFHVSNLLVVESCTLDLGSMCSMSTINGYWFLVLESRYNADQHIVSLLQLSVEHHCS
jgi:hypothetical protein